MHPVKILISLHNAQAALKLRWLHMSDGTFSSIAAHNHSFAAFVYVEPYSVSWPHWLRQICIPTGYQKVVGLIPAWSGSILSWQLIMKYF